MHASPMRIKRFFIKSALIFVTVILLVTVPSGFGWSEAGKGFHAKNIPIHDTSGGGTVSVNDLKISPKARNYFRSGLEAIHAARWQKAIDAFSHALAINAEYAKAYNGLGVAYAVTGLDGKAEDAFRNAIRIDDKLAEAHFNLGKLLVELNRPAEATLHLRDALNSDAHDVFAIELLVDSMLSTHDEDSAVGLMRSLDSKNVVHPAELHLRIGAALEDHSQNELATEQYSLVIQESSSETERSEAAVAISRVRR
jgi:tetratricopeptide (TPR) repeat protein